MDKIQQLEKIKNQSKKNFFSDIKNKIEILISDLITFRLIQDEKTLKPVRIFFHNLNGTAGTLGLKTLSDIGQQCQKELDLAKKTTNYSDVLFSNLLLSIATIQVELNNETLNVPKILEHPKKEDIIISTDNDSEYKYLISTGNILILDDDVGMLDLLYKMFRDAGFYVVICSTASEANQILKEKTFDILILDVIMPEINGIEFLKNLRKQGNTVPTIFITADSKIEYKLSSFDKNYEDFIIKPFDMLDLFNKVENIMYNFSKTIDHPYNDELTGAFNISFLNENFRYTKNRFIKSNENFCIGYVDINNFKAINNEFSTEEGDCVLQVFYTTLKKHLNASDQIYRHYADKFIILLPNCDLEYALNIIDNALKDFHETNFKTKNGEKIFNCSFSSGISTMLNNNDNLFTVIDRAKQSLEKSKKEDKNN